MLYEHDLIEMMGGNWPPEDPEQREAYWQVFNQRLVEVYGDDALSEWTLLAHSGDLWGMYRDRK